MDDDSLASDECLDAFEWKWFKHRWYFSLFWDMFFAIYSYITIKKKLRKCERKIFRKIFHDIFLKKIFKICFENKSYILRSRYLKISLSKRNFQTKEFHCRILYRKELFRITKSYFEISISHFVCIMFISICIIYLFSSIRNNNKKKNKCYNILYKFR